MGSIPGSGRSPGGGHSNPLHIHAWRIPLTEEPGGLQSMGSQGVGSDLAQTPLTQHCLRPDFFFSFLESVLLHDF